MLAIAASLGVDLTSAKPERESPEPTGPSIAELTALAQTKIGRDGDTTAATRELLKAMAG